MYIVLKPAELIYNVETGSVVGSPGWETGDELTAVEHKGTFGMMKYPIS